MSRRRITLSSYAKTRMSSPDASALDADGRSAPLAFRRETGAYPPRKGSGSRRLSPHHSDTNTGSLEQKHRKPDRVYTTGSNKVPPIFDGVFWDEEEQQEDNRATTGSHLRLESFGFYSKQKDSARHSSFVSHNASGGFYLSPRNEILSEYNRKCCPPSKDFSARETPTSSFKPRVSSRPLTPCQPATCQTGTVERSRDWLDDLAARTFYPKMDVSELRKRWDTLTHLVWDKIPKTGPDAATPSPRGPHQLTDEAVCETSGFSGLLLGIEALKLATLKAAAAGQSASIQSPVNKSPVIEKCSTISGSRSMELSNHLLGRGQSHNETRPSAPPAPFPEDGESNDNDSDKDGVSATIIQNGKSELHDPWRQRWGHGKPDTVSNLHTYGPEAELLVCRRKLDRLQEKLTDKRSQLKSQRRAFRKAINRLQSERGALLKRLSVANDEREQQEISISKMALQLERKAKDLVLARYEKLRLRRLLRQATETLQRYAPGGVPLSSQQEPWRQSFSALKIDSLGRRTPISLRLVATHSGVLALWVRALDGTDVLYVELSRLTRLAPLLVDRVYDSEALSSRCLHLQTAATDSLDVEFPNAEVATAFSALVLRLHRAALVSQRHQQDGATEELPMPLIRPSKTCVLELQKFFLGGNFPSQPHSYRLSRAFLSKAFSKQRPMLTAPASATRTLSQQRPISVNRRLPSSRFETDSRRETTGSVVPPYNCTMKEDTVRLLKNASFSSFTPCSSMSSRACSPEQQPDFSKRHLDLFLNRLCARAANARHPLHTSLRSGRRRRRSRSKGNASIALSAEQASSSFRSSISLDSSQTRISDPSVDYGYSRAPTRHVSERDQHLNLSSGRSNRKKKKVTRLLNRSRASNTTQRRPSYFSNHQRSYAFNRSPLSERKRPEKKFQSACANLEKENFTPSGLLHLRSSSRRDKSVRRISPPPPPPPPPLPQEQPLLALEKVLLQENHTSTSQSADPDDTDSSGSCSTTTLSSTGTPNPNSLQQNRQPLPRNLGAAVETCEPSSALQKEDTCESRRLLCFETLHRCTETTQATTSSSVPSPLTNALSKSYTIQLEKPIPLGTPAPPPLSHRNVPSLEDQEKSYESGSATSNKNHHQEGNDSTILESSSPHPTNVIFSLDSPQ